MITKNIKALKIAFLLLLAAIYLYLLITNIFISNSSDDAVTIPENDIAVEKEGSVDEKVYLTFDDFKKPPYSGEKANLDISGSNVSAFADLTNNEKESLNELLKKDSRPFAGKYTVLITVCGDECYKWYVFDQVTGKIYDSELTSPFMAHFEKDSSLFIVNPPELLIEKYGATVPENLFTYYYEWKDNKMELITEATIYPVGKIGGKYFYDITKTK